MENQSNIITSRCSFAGIRPAMMDLPYPDTAVRERNAAYANLLSTDYCGAVSELSAITQYLNNESRLSCDNCSLARTLLGIAIAEMMHLQKLAELIVLLGGTVDFSAKMPNGRRKLWSPEYLTLPEQTKAMLRADIESEKAAIAQYRAHMKLIKDDCVNAVLARIILDEEYHIFLLQAA